MPPPASPVTSMLAISACARCMLACNCCACFIMLPMLPFMGAPKGCCSVENPSSVRSVRSGHRPDRFRLHGGAEHVAQCVHVRIIVDGRAGGLQSVFCGCLVLARRGIVQCRAHLDFELDALTE